MASSTMFVFRRLDLRSQSQASILSPLRKSSPCSLLPSSLLHLRSSLLNPHLSPLLSCQKPLHESLSLYRCLFHEPLLGPTFVLLLSQAGSG
ncbi:hypothetical protein AVEN_175142-1 [Araneus ventricosus]|uniref:Uncharacterized protein n=1 Tax=Araneus ventricosus TaxID=182803 RepID=A0A4Y2W3S6_ARAVE|nr:hypothetical protein AVEN_175142-1 [Araneus ventricosus]